MIPFDVSIFKNINLTSPENIIFLAIISVLIIIVLFIFLFVFVKIIKIIRKLIKAVFSAIKKPKLKQKVAADLPKKQAQNKIDPINMPREKNTGGYFIKTSAVENKKEAEKEKKQIYKEKEGKAISKDLNRLKAEGHAGEATLESKLP
jgi:hypothetical protein